MPHDKRATAQAALEKTLFPPRTPPKHPSYVWLRKLEEWSEMEQQEALAAFKEETGLPMSKAPKGLKLNPQKFAKWLEENVR